MYSAAPATSERAPPAETRGKEVRRRFVCGDMKEGRSRSFTDHYSLALCVKIMDYNLL